MRRGSGGHTHDVPARKGQLAGRHLKHLTAGVRLLAGKLSIALLVLVICSLSLLSRLREDRLFAQSQVDVSKLWTNPHGGWRSSSAPRSHWPPPLTESNGYLLVRCNGGLNQQRSAICNAVLAARIMNATLILPELDTNSFWHDKSGFAGIYDVDHFIKTLKYDVKVLRGLHELSSIGKKKRGLKPFQLRPPRDAPPSWYETVALEKMKEHGVLYLTPFSHRLTEELDNPEYQRLRCRVNYHALRFKSDIMKLSSTIVNRLRSQGHFIAIHLRFEMDMLAFAGCLDIFTLEEQEALKRYREKNFAAKVLVYNERRIIGKCPLTPEEVGLILHAMGFDNSTRIYLAAGEIFGGERFMQPLRALFPHLENQTTIARMEELAAVNAEGSGLLGPAVDYMVSLLSDIFMPTYDGPSNFANNVLGHRLYYGFRSTIQPDRKALASIFIDRERGRSQNFEGLIRQIMQRTPSGGPHKRIHPESFYTNPWPECFCQTSTVLLQDKCPSDNVIDVLNGQLFDASGLEDSSTHIDQIDSYDSDANSGD